MEQRFYTLDRQGALREGAELDLRRYVDLSPPELQQHVDTLFPKGVSSHGNTHFLDSGTKVNAISPAVELIFEYVRRAFFPDRPSRFTSFFGVATLSEAVEFKHCYREQRGSIWEVKASGGFRGNMNLLTSDQSNLVCSYFAHLYWQGEVGPVKPFWEVLLTPPIKVLRKVVAPEAPAWDSS